MYDSINIEIKCPKCSEKSMMEAQTKELDSDLNVWELGCFLSNKVDYLGSIASCDNCNHYFSLNVLLDKGIITGEYHIIDN